MNFTYLNHEKKTDFPCIFKIWVGKKYYIFKTIKITPLLANLMKQIDREVQVFREDSALLNLIKEVVSTGAGIVNIEIVKNYPDTDNQHRFKLLVDEYQALQAAKKDKNCLNDKFINHDRYPKWIDQQTINEFKDFYSKGKKGSSVKDSNLRKYLRKIGQKPMLLDDFVDHVSAYVKERYK